MGALRTTGPTDAPTTAVATCPASKSSPEISHEGASCRCPGPDNPGCRTSPKRVMARRISSVQVSGHEPPTIWDWDRWQRGRRCRVVATDHGQPEPGGGDPHNRCAQPPSPMAKPNRDHCAFSQRIVWQAPPRRPQIHERGIRQKVRYARHIDISVPFDILSQVALVVARPHQQPPAPIEQLSGSLG